jgi:hypothetical protein
MTFAIGAFVAVRDADPAAAERGRSGLGGSLLGYLLPASCWLGSPRSGSTGSS